MLLAQSVHLTALRGGAQHVGKVLFTLVVVLAAETAQVFLFVPTLALQLASGEQVLAFRLEIFKVVDLRIFTWSVTSEIVRDLRVETLVLGIPSGLLHELVLINNLVGTGCAVDLLKEGLLVC